MYRARFPDDHDRDRTVRAVEALAVKVEIVAVLAARITETLRGAGVDELTTAYDQIVSTGEPDPEPTGLPLDEIDRLMGR